MLKDVRDDMIGCPDTKLAYFNKALVETLVPMLVNKKGLDAQVKNEIFTVLNSLLTSVEKASATFELHFGQLTTAICGSIK